MDFPDKLPGMSCPRHGRDLPVDLGPRIRCDCPSTVLSALWDAGDPELQFRLKLAIDFQHKGVLRAIMEAYHLGLRGGVR